MHYSFFIEARFCPEITERILRIIRHRGFRLYSLNVQLQGNKVENKIINLFITVVSNRSANLLFFQLKKLVDIIYIEFR
ncbi:acetolactate synthase 2 small subunit [Blochmannia endosymbiont of Colobopsis nipponica]|uniref:acetolactate synthase 2 small subunit n=1 Tax=Blochmannia endosymbiont of Colobopsis nipponica TaxID=2681987 RepID=UPI00298EEC48|nr:acetolactate synthase 2 small subunit [Blochmannia endosymbiont of Colobopsis nipponica]